MNKAITTRTHGLLDYSLGALLLFAPNILGFADAGAAAWAPRVVGLVAIFQSLFTRFELGLFKVLPMRMHLVNDYIAGAFLAASPWLFRFYQAGNERVWMPHVVAGLAILLVTAMTETHPRRLDATPPARGHAV